MCSPLVKGITLLHAILFLPTRDLAIVHGRRSAQDGEPNGRRRQEERRQVEASPGCQDQSQAVDVTVELSGRHHMKYHRSIA